MNQIIKSKDWENSSKLFTIAIPVFNRSNTVLRTLSSIENQTYKDFEIIIVDDGSTDDIDKVILPFISTTESPVLYIKKENGGVHTARNIGVIEARGKFYIEIDSDDELTTNALEIFKDAWDSIPTEIREEYREVVGLCKDEKSNICGTFFPSNINELPWKDAHEACIKTDGEHLGCSITKIRKDNLFPEPQGVTFYNENILWAKLAQKYKSFFINKIVRIYHTEGDDHLNTVLDKTKKRKTIQQCKNGLWECSCMLNNWRIYKNYVSFFPTIIRYSLMKQILRKTNKEFCQENTLKGFKNLSIYYLTIIPVLLFSYCYKAKRM